MKKSLVARQIRRRSLSDASESSVARRRTLETRMFPTSHLKCDMTISLRAFLLAAMLCAVCGSARAAEEDKISTDRPDFLTAPDTVGKGRFQIEFGGLVQRDDPGDTRTRTVLTPTLLRLGLTDRLELRLETDGRVRTSETTLPTQTTVHEQGWADTSLGIKWNTHKGSADTGTPSIGWVFDAEMPSGSRAFRDRGIRPRVLGAFQFELANDMDFSANAGLKYDNNDVAGRFFSATLGAGFSKGLTDRVKVLAEVVAQQIARKRYGGNVVIADVAMTYLLTNSVQVDALVGHGLTSESPKYVFTIGISARF